MTAKQKKLIEVATDLFAREGFAATSTAKIAREAGTSEGLIFRHFRSKQGLLDAIASVADEQSSAELDRLAQINDPAERIQFAIDDAFAKRKKDAAIDAIRTQLSAIDTSFGESRTKAYEKLLSEAFASLQYDDAAVEAKFLRCALDGIRQAIAQGNLSGAKKLKDFVSAMYD